MRVAFFTETFLPATDGVVTRLRYTLRELARLGDEALVIAPRYPEGGPAAFAGHRIFRVPGVPFPPYPQIRLAPANPGVGRELRRFGPDLIHAVNPYILGMAAPFYARRLKVPLVASYHTNVAAYARFYRLGFLHRAARLYTRAVHNRAAVNLCTSSATLEYLRGEGIRALRLWPQGVDCELFGPHRASGRWRERLSGGHPDAGLLLFVGRLAPEKGIEQLRAALDKMPGVRLALVGDGPARPALQRVFAGTPTVFTGVLHGEELAAAYASADLFVFPSTTETLGMAMLEALASGVPVIAARSGASREVVDDGETGLLYEPGSVSSLAAAAHRLLADEPRRASMARRARAAAERRSWEAATRTLRGCYLEALGSR
ncbi:glycosyl transferase, group 1 [Rubrobacter xylanophilus DSM 9941]|uniref:Glycosyl transferase, group 1 n=1 Tax=Rubrobacter xylanophilus (strain DSM 9941 / JCM 11954 / NBRC 16129 / PRD-1) TaxID=266117 RepID=Q1AWG6_RUBXD|nr:glycosyltransferase family 1 protein [Rubrobacter xylanophilus]ABG04262.1 glycosyl transferase, group 1 [Rubrobacter xylanophilus DSM 9941]